jgi:hypothetical protein
VSTKNHLRAIELVKIIGDISICPENPDSVKDIPRDELAKRISNGDHLRYVPLEDIEKYDGFGMQELTNYLENFRKIDWVKLTDSKNRSVRLTYRQSNWIYVNQRDLGQYFNFPESDN